GRRDRPCVPPEGVQAAVLAKPPEVAPLEAAKVFPALPRAVPLEQFSRPPEVPRLPQRQPRSSLPPGGCGGTTAKTAPPGVRGGPGSARRRGSVAGRPPGRPRWGTAAPAPARSPYAGDRYEAGQENHYQRHGQACHQGVAVAPPPKPLRLAYAAGPDRL